jgi:membrane-bound metal-dependent hydrolase YbcI (DUF457 family)
MDVVSHAIAGACVGQAFGQPVLGAAFGVLPDVVLGVRRQKLPSTAYNATHSLTFVAGAGLAGWLVWGTLAPLLAVLSHILLDFPTHGPRWAPTLLYPFSSERFGIGSEWEWFNKTWWLGLGLTAIWSLTWLAVAYS